MMQAFICFFMQFKRRIFSCTMLLIACFIGLGTSENVISDSSNGRFFEKVSGILHVICTPRYASAGDSNILSVDPELLPVSEQTAETLPHFPNRTAAFVWRNWNLIPIEDIAATLQTDEVNIERYATWMGLPPQKKTSWDTESIYITILRRNWSLIPYDQLLTLLHFDASELAKKLREDDFLYVKLGSKPLCEPLVYEEPTETEIGAMRRIADETSEIFSSDAYLSATERFDFLREFDSVDATFFDSVTSSNNRESTFKLCYLHSYFGLFGDPLLQDCSKMFPDALLRKLAVCGVNGVWFHSLLRDLAPPSDEFPEFGEKSEIRRANLRQLVTRAKRYGIDVYLYMNEPRAMPSSFFTNHEDARGVVEGAYSAMCASSPKVHKWLSDALAGLFSDVPGLGGIFTITGSENLTSCVSHGKFTDCPRCSKFSDTQLLVDLNTAMEEGVHRVAPDAKVIVWDWGWRGHGMATDVIELLPKSVWFQSVSEWAIPLERGGVPVTVGEYSISVVGPGTRALVHWNAAKKAGLRTVAKCQFNTTWEIGSVPYIPALELIARHASNLSRAGIDGVMAGWSLGGFPSINLELVDKIARTPDVPIDSILNSLAVKYFGKEGAESARNGWSVISSAFEEFPYSGSVVYYAPNQIGTANLLRLTPTGWRSTMVGIPYDDLDSWRGPYPADVFADQMEKCGRGFLEGGKLLKSAAAFSPNDCSKEANRQALYAMFAGSVFISVANQTRFVVLRDERNVLMHERDEKGLSREKDMRLSDIEAEMIAITEDEIELAKTTLDASLKDSCIGFESTNQYWFVPNDLVEKILSCHDIIRRIKEGTR